MNTLETLVDLIKEDLFYIEKNQHELLDINEIEQVDKVNSLINKEYSLFNGEEYVKEFPLINYNACKNCLFPRVIPSYSILSLKKDFKAHSLFEETLHYTFFYDFCENNFLDANEIKNL